MKIRYSSTLGCLCPLLCAAGLLAGFQATLHAQTVDTWDGGTGNWSNGALWSAGVPNSASASVFVDGGNPVNSTVTVDGSYTVGALNISSGDAVNVNNGQTFTITDSGGFTGAGTLTNNGAFTLGNSSGGSTLFFTGTTTLAGTGTLTLVNNDVVLSSGGNGTVTVGSGQTIQGATGTGGGVGFGSGQLGIVNQGTFNANISGGTLTIQPGGANPTFVNSNGQIGGTLEATNGGTLLLSNASGGTFNISNGGMVVTDGSTITVPAAALTTLNGTTLTGGSYEVSATSAANPATLSFVGGSVVTNNATVYLIGPGAVFNAFNTVANNTSNGAIDLESGHNLTTTGGLTNAGYLGAFSSSTLTVSGALNNSGQAYFHSGTNTDTIQGNVTNSGLIGVSISTLNVQGTLTSSGVLSSGLSSTAGGEGGATPGGSIVATGAVTQTSTGTLLGTGSVTAPTLSLAGSIRPGDGDTGGLFGAAVGTLTLNGQVGLLSNTVLVFDLASTAASDRITVNGSLTLAGMLNVNALTGFGAGRYDLVDYSGALTNNGLALGTLPSGYNYAIDTSMAGQVDLVVTNAVPEPSTWVSMLGGMSLLSLTLSRCRRQA